MTEYDYSPAAYERYMQNQCRIAHWVDRHVSHNPPFPALSSAGHLANGASSTKATENVVDSDESPGRRLAHHSRALNCKVCGSSDMPLRGRGVGNQMCVRCNLLELQKRLEIDVTAVEDDSEWSKLIVNEEGNYVIPRMGCFATNKIHDDSDSENPDPDSNADLSSSTTKQIQKQAHMFTNARNISIRDATIHNARRDNITVIHNHNYPADANYDERRHSLPHEIDTKADAWDFISRISTLMPRASAYMFHAADMIKSILPRGFSTLFGMHLGNSAAQDTVKYPPLNAMMLLSRTTMCIPGFTSQTLSSIRYAFFSS